MESLVEKLLDLPPLSMWFEPYYSRFEHFNKIREFIRKNQENET